MAEIFVKLSIVIMVWTHLPTESIAQLGVKSDTNTGTETIFIADTGKKQVLAKALSRPTPFRSLFRADLEVWDITFSEVNQKLYFGSKNDGHVYESNPDGTRLRRVSTEPHTEPTSLAVDESTQMIYVAYKGSESISGFSLNETRPETVVHTGLSKPGAIYVDAENGYLYFTEFGRVVRSNLTGGPKTYLDIPGYLKDALGEIEAIAVNLEVGKIVISDPGNGQVLSMNLDRSGVALLRGLGSYKITDLQFYKGDLYVSNERENKSIMKFPANALPVAEGSRPATTINIGDTNYPRKFHIANVL